MTPDATHYSFDTSALIDGIERFYPIANFPALWERIDQLTADGRLHVSEAAWSEAMAVDSVLKEWCKDETHRPQPVCCANRCRHRGSGGPNCGAVPAVGATRHQEQG